MPTPHWNTNKRVKLPQKYFLNVYYTREKTKDKDQLIDLACFSKGTSGSVSTHYMKQKQTATFQFHYKEKNLRVKQIFKKLIKIYFGML